MVFVFRWIIKTVILCFTLSLTLFWCRKCKSVFGINEFNLFHMFKDHQVNVFLFVALRRSHVWIWGSRIRARPILWWCLSPWDGSTSVNIKPLVSGRAESLWTSPVSVSEAWKSASSFHSLFTKRSMTFRHRSCKMNKYGNAPTSVEL